jgi:hypothetical protein
VIAPTTPGLHQKRVATVVKRAILQRIVTSRRTQLMLRAVTAMRSATFLATVLSRATGPKLRAVTVAKVSFHIRNGIVRC